MASKLLFPFATILIAATPIVWADEAFKAKLAGDQEVPPVVTKTNGKFKMEVNRARAEAEFTLSVNDGVRITQAHLHCGVVGVNGPVIVNLAANNAPGYNVDGKWISNVTLTDTSIANATTPCGRTIADLVAAIGRGSVYANVHSVQFPAGVIRGQVEASDGD